MGEVAVALALLLIVFASLVYLQVSLSNCRKKWLGLILPAISLCLSVLSVIDFVDYLYKPKIKFTKETFSFVKPIYATPTLILQILVIFLLTSIPTVVFLSVYFYYRKKHKQKLRPDDSSLGLNAYQANQVE